MMRQRPALQQRLALQHRLPVREALRGLGSLAATLGALLVVTFALSSLSPIDPALQLLGDHASSSAYAQVRHELGLDVSWPRRFGRYLAHVAHGDLGISRSTGQPVSEDLDRMFPATFELATLAMVVATLLGIALAGMSVLRPNGMLDASVRIISIVGTSIPIFWLGLIALLVFYARLHWTGGAGRLSDAYEYTTDMKTGWVLIDAWRSDEPGALRDAVAHLVLPMLVLASYALGAVTRLTRAALLGEARKEYVTLARAKGASETRIVWRHLAPNALGVILTVLALTYANLLEGAVLIETVFARPGLGRYLTTALFAADMPAILGATLLIGACFVLINGLADVVVRLWDPRTS
jgi:peptide/nickel transport system permease protein